MSVFHENMLIGSSGQGGAAASYQVERILRFNSADSAYLSRTPASAGNRKTWTWAGWVKLGATGTVRQIFTSRPTSSPYALFYIFSDDKISFADNILNAHTTAAVYRDPSAWYHIQLAVDTTDATAGNRVRLWVNGVLQTWASTTAPTQNADGQINTATAHSIGSQQPFSGSEYFNGYLADIHLIDGQALDPTSFTEVDATTGQLKPKAYTGSFGTNGFWLKFSDNSAATATTLGKDYSPNGNNWTPNNLSVTAGSGNDSLVDTPTSYGTDTGAGGEVRGNYATLNPLDNGGQTLSNGNIQFDRTPASWASTRATVGMSSGKWYWEVTLTSGTDLMVGISKNNASQTSFVGAVADGWAYYSGNGNKYNNNSNSAYGNTFTTNDVVGISFDADAGQLKFYKNGVVQNSGTAAFTGLTSGPYFPAASLYGGTPVGTAHINFGQRPFAYTAPSGFKALCDTNLPAPVVAKPSEVMDVKLYTGNGSTQTISGLGFSPDLVWIKERSAAINHLLFDQVRGVRTYLISNATNAEATAPTHTVTAFNSDGFSVSDTSDGAWGSNGLNKTYVGWTWDAGTSTVTNTQGSITSQVRANASSGFSITTFTAPSSGSATIGHGLGVEPHMIIIKSRDQAYNWCVYHKALTSNAYFLNLNTTAAQSNASNIWNNTTPTSTVFSLGSGYAGAGATVAYLFSPVAGYSSAFSYSGNGSSDGSFVYLGFRPKLVLIKRSDSSENWYLWDTMRDTYNLAGKNLLPNLSNAESSIGGAFSATLDILSNGFKLRDAGAGTNASGGTYIGFAWAEHPFAYARAR